MINKILRVVFSLGFAFCFVMACFGIYFIFLQYPKVGLEGVTVNIITDLIFILLAIGCYLGLRGIKKNESKNLQRLDPIDRTIKKIDNCLALKQLKNNKQIIKSLDIIKTILLDLKEKNYTFNENLQETVDPVLDDLTEIANAPTRKTNQGKKLLDQIERKLEAISNTLERIKSSLSEEKIINNQKLITHLKRTLNEIDNPELKRIKVRRKTKEQIS